MGQPKVRFAQNCLSSVAINVVYPRSERGYRKRVWLLLRELSFHFTPQLFRFGFESPAQLAEAREVGFGFRQSVQPQQRDRAVVPRFSQARRELDGLIEISQGARVIPLSGPDRAARQPGFGVARIELDGLVKVTKRAPGVALEEACLGAIGVEIAPPGVELDGLVKNGERAVNIALLGQNAAAIVERYGVAWVEFERLLAVAERRIQLAPGIARAAAVDPGIDQA